MVLSQPKEFNLSQLWYQKIEDSLQSNWLAEVVIFSCAHLGLGVTEYESLDLTLMLMLAVITLASLAKSKFHFH